jgi:hypothetical protein
MELALDYPVVNLVMAAMNLLVPLCYYMLFWVVKRSGIHLVGQI